MRPYRIGAGAGYAGDRIDPAVVVAMIAWGLVGLVTIRGLRLFFRP